MCDTKTDKGPIKHHFVPVCYVNGFSANEQPLWCHNAEVNRAFFSAPKNIAYIKHDNTLRESDGSIDNSKIEGVFSEYESRFASTMKKLNAEGLTKEILKFLLFFANLQRSRSPASRDLLSTLAMRLTENFSDRELKQLGVDEFELDLIRRARSGDQHAVAQIRLRLSGQLWAPTEKQIYRMSYVLLESAPDRKFLTSDNPVFISGFRRLKKGFSLSLSDTSNDIFLSYPVSAKYALVGASTFKFKEPIVRTGSSAEIAHLNKITALHAQSFIYSGSAPTGSFQRKYIFAKTSESTSRKALDMMARSMNHLEGKLRS